MCMSQIAHCIMLWRYSQVLAYHMYACIVDFNITNIKNNYFIKDNKGTMGYDIEKIGLNIL